MAFADRIENAEFRQEKYGHSVGALKPDTSNSLSGDYSNSTTSSFSNTEIVRIIAKNDNADIEIGTSPSASSGDTYMPQDLPNYFIVNSGEKVSVNGDINLMVMR